jgi:hypothetical protein
LPDIAISLSLHHEGDHPCQNLDRQQRRTDTKDPHQRPELAAIQFRAATHVQSKVTLSQMERKWLPFRWLSADVVLYKCLAAKERRRDGRSSDQRAGARPELDD